MQIRVINAEALSLGGYQQVLIAAEKNDPDTRDPGNIYSTG
jgi:hypothetical protein